MADSPSDSDLRELARHEARAVLPPPADGGRPVTPDLLTWIYKHGNSSHATAIAEGVLERHYFGVKKYGKGLTTDDSRPTHAETLQELLDALQYGHKAEMMGESLDTPLMVEALRLLRLKIEPKALHAHFVMAVARTVILVGVSLAVGFILGRA